MSKMLLTNNKMWSSSLRNSWRELGFTENAHRDCGDAHFTVYKKLNVDNVNYYEANGDFASSVGCLFYDDCFGEDALKRLLEDAKKDDIRSLRAKTIGSFAVAVKTANRMIVFVDETHTYDLYYCVCDNGDFIVTNTFYHIEKCVGRPVNANAVVERGVRGGVSSLETPFDGVVALGARQYLEVDLSHSTMALRSCELNDYRCSFEKREDAVLEIWRRAQHIAELRSKYLNKSLYFVTGGVNSRLELSASVHNGEQVTLGYWMGSDSISNGTVRDKEVQESIASLLSCECVCYDVSVPFESVLQCITSSTCDKYGELASIYCGNAKWYSIFETIDDKDYIGFGFFGETLRNIDSLDVSYKEPFTLRDYVEKVYCRTHIEEIVKTDGFYDYLADKAACLVGCKEGGESVVDIDTCGRLFGYSRFSADCALSNFANLFTYSFPLFGMKQVADAVFAMPYEWRSGDYIAIAMTKLWSSELLSIPYHSHHHDYVCNQETLCLERVGSDKSIVGVLKRIKPLRSFYRKHLRSHMKNGRSEWDALYAYCHGRLLESPFLRQENGFDISAEEPDEIEIATLATFIGQTRVLEHALGIR